MQKILIFTHEFPPRLGGAGGVALQLADYFYKYHYDVTVVTQKRNNIIDYKFKIIEVPVFTKLWFLSYFTFFKFYNLKQYDKIIINDGGAIYSAGISFNEEALSKSIVYVHGVEKYLNEASLFLKILQFKKYYLRVLNKSQKIISVSGFIKELFFKDELEEFLPKVKVIYNGVDKTQFYYKDNSLLDRYVSPNDIVLISVSRFTQSKGYLKKLEIFEKLYIKNKNHKWFIIGDGDFKDTFTQIVKTKNLEKNIILLGKKSREEIKYYLSKSNFFWLLSELEESFGLVYLEAMACKSIPIGWNKAGVKEVIKNGINGCLANTDDEVISFVLDGYKTIDRENLPNQVIKVEDNYCKVLN